MRIVFSIAISTVLASAAVAGDTVQAEEALVTEPLWSPDGKRLMFAAGAGNLDVFTISADGSGLTRVACSDSIDYWADWSPDGRRITFTSTRDGGDAVYVSDLASGKTVRVSPAGLRSVQSVWSPDGKQLVFRAYDQPGTTRVANLWLVAPDGSGAKALTTGPHQYEDPAWSRDGTKILVTASVDRTTALLQLVPVNGSAGVTLTTPAAGTPHGGSWSPDGKRIAFYSTVSGNSEVYVMNADGSGITNVSNHESRDFVSQWRADGTRLVIWSNRDRRRNAFYEIDLTDKSTRRLTLIDSLNLTAACTEKR